jgi:hypothetical protein
MIDIVSGVIDPLRQQRRSLTGYYRSTSPKALFLPGLQEARVSH